MCTIPVPQASCEVKFVAIIRGRALATLMGWHFFQVK